MKVFGMSSAPVLALVVVMLLVACGDAGDQDGRLAPPQAPAAREAFEPAAHAVVARGPRAGQDAGGAGDVAESRIEERRHYTLQFDQATALTETYHAVHEACVVAESCQVEQGRLQTPRHGQASAELAMRVARAVVDEVEPIQLITESRALSGVEINRSDRTQQIIDLQARLQQQTILRERLQELAREGREFSERSIQDLLQVERELARVQGEIESMQGRQRYLSRVTDTVAVNVSLHEQRWVEPRQHGVLAPLWRALDRSAELFFQSVGQVILVVVFLTPWLVLGIPALWLLTRLWRPLRRVFSRRRSAATRDEPS